MRSRFVAVILLLALAAPAFAEEIAYTESGKKVILHDDGTWEYAGSEGPKDAPTAWKVLNSNWEYRNATLRRQPILPTFIVELRRTRGSASMTMFTVTLYNPSGGIAATGSTAIFDSAPGTVHTAEFVLGGDPGDSKRFRLQVDAEV